MSRFIQHHGPVIIGISMVFLIPMVVINTLLVISVICGLKCCHWVHFLYFNAEYYSILIRRIAILARRGVKPFLESYRDFRRATPDVKHLLARYGMVESPARPAPHLCQAVRDKVAAGEVKTDEAAVLPWAVMLTHHNSSTMYAVSLAKVSWHGQLCSDCIR